MMSSNHRSQPDIYLPQMATVMKSEPMTARECFVQLKMDSGEELGHLPGQFVEVSVMGIGEAPISISSSPTQKETFEIVVRDSGNVTGAIHRLKPGDKVGIRGPFGHHFPVESHLKGKNIVFVCGGLGMAPVRSAINYTLDHRQDYGDLTILVGAKSPAERLFIDETPRWMTYPKVHYTETVDQSDEKWSGQVGVITTLMTDMRVDPQNSAAIVCGPPVMYKFVVLQLFKMGLAAEDIYLSLERHMKCGVGKCGHCQINGLYVCQDGPVFTYASIAEIPEAIA